MNQRPVGSTRGVWALLVLSACAQPVTDGDADEGSGGSASGGEGGTGTWTPVDSMHTAPGSGAATSASSSTSNTTGSGGCGPGQHFCGGVCTGSTPGTGCSQSASCEPCTAPAHGTPTCTAMGTCDFTCAAGYQEVGDQCECALPCCSDADCGGGNVCSGGTCQPPPCYLQDCLESCLFSLKCGGFCVGNTCTCLPCQ